MRDFVFVGRFGLAAAACGVALSLAWPVAAAQKPAPAATDAPAAAPAPKPAAPAAKPAAPAAVTPAPAGAPPAAGSDQTIASPWVKLCDTEPASKKEMCIVSQEIHSNTGQFVVSATIRQITGDDKIW